MTRQDKSNLVAVGGGSGLATLLRGLKHAVGERLEDLTAIVTVADDGGSSGRLRRDFGVLPPAWILRTVISLRVSVPVLSEQMTVVQPSVSAAGR